MILHDFKCKHCGNIFEEAVPSDFEIAPRCKKCKGKSDMVFLPRGRNAVNFDPVVIFKGPDGKVRFPGRSNSRPPKGYERVELTSVAQVRQFEKHMNKNEFSRWQDKTERDEKMWKPYQQDMRNRLREAMQHMSPQGRDFAEAAMRRNDTAPRKRFDPGFYSEAFSNNAGNRQAWLDRDTDMRGRK